MSARTKALAMTPTTVDPVVTVVAWSGTLTQLAARLGMDPRRLQRAAVRRHGRLELDIDSPVAMLTLKRQIRPPEAE